jgi:general stress protein CsbA
MPRLDRYLIGLVLGHFVVNLVHASAHVALQILPAGLDLAFIVGVILIGPLVALVIMRFNRPLATGLIAVLMGAAFVYGLTSHFLVSGPDNVSLVGSQSWTVLFVGTAVTLGVLELGSLLVAVIVFWAATRTPSEPVARVG